MDGKGKGTQKALSLGLTFHVDLLSMTVRSADCETTNATAASTASTGTPSSVIRAPVLPHTRVTREQAAGVLSFGTDQR